MKKYVQFTAGRGPVECARACQLIFEKFCQEAVHSAFVNIIDVEKHNTEYDCIMSAMIQLTSDNDIDIIKLQKAWEGTILYKAISNKYRPNHKRKNWFVGCKFIDPLELPNIDEKDIKYESMRASGNGGQNVNKVESCVRATHIPTNISVKCSIERSQAQNKELARKLLMIKLGDLNNEKQENFKNSNWSNHTQLERGNPIKTFEGKL